MKLLLNGGKVNDNVFAGGLATLGGKATVEKALVQVNGAEVTGNMYGGGVAGSYQNEAFYADYKTASSNVKETTISLINGSLNGDPILAPAARLVISLRILFALAVFLFTFVGLYTIVPAKKQKPRQQLPGAVFTAVGWLIFSYAFSIYFTHFSNFSYMYGSLTAVVLLMLWLYICICILFVGAELNGFLEKSHYHI